MKKFTVYSLTALLALSAISVQTNPPCIDKTTLKEVAGDHIYSQLTFYKGRYSWKRPLEWLLTTGGITSGVVATGHYLCSSDQNVTSSLTWAAVSGAALGVSYVVGRYSFRFAALQKIRTYLHEYSGYNDLQEVMDDAAGMIIIAAEQKDIETMRKLAPYISSFLDKTGIWQVLTELYFHTDEADTQVKGTSKSIGYQRNGEHNAEGVVLTKHNQKMKHRFMEPATMERRMNALKAKLGY